MRARIAALAAGTHVFPSRTRGLPSEIAALRDEGLTRALSSSDLERRFALGFALEQLHQNLGDLRRCVQEWARPGPA